MSESLLETPEGEAPEGDSPTPEGDVTPNKPSFNLTEVLDEDGNSFKKDVDWEKVLGESHGYISKYKSMKDAVEGIKHLNQLASGKVEPGPEIPETPEGYGIKKPDELPEGVEWDEEVTNKYLETLHKHKASPELVKELVELNLGIEESRYAKANRDLQHQQEAFREEERNKLEDEYGVGLKGVLNRAARAAMAVGLDPEKNPLFATADNVKAFAKVADLIGEDHLPNDTRSPRKVAYDEAMQIMQGHHELSKAYYDGDLDVARRVQKALKYGSE